MSNARKCVEWPFPYGSSSSSAIEMRGSDRSQHTTCLKQIYKRPIWTTNWMDLLPLWDETRVPVGQSHGSEQWLANVGDTVQVTTLAALYDRNFLQLNKGIRSFYRFSLS